MFEFHTGYVHVDDSVRRLSFADRNHPSAEHYFMMDRSEESPEEAVADLKNVYIERDDQCWGGYGGIELVILDRDSLTLNLSPRMATRMGGHHTIRVSFMLKDAQFRELRQVLRSLMQGYGSRLELREERSAVGNLPVEFSVYETPTAEADRAR